MSANLSTRPRAATRPARWGMTLVELMTVIAIVILVMAVAIPAVRPALRSRKVREATRLVGAYVNSAKARAVEKGRPVGIWIERLDKTTDIGSLQSLQMYIAETPPPYQGDVVNARAVVTFNSGTGNFDIAFPGCPTLDRLVLPGEAFKVKFDTKGRTFLCRRLGLPATYIIILNPVNGIIPPGLTPLPGVDGGWGRAGIDDDGANGVDDFLGEWLSPGSDDEGGLTFTITLSPRRSNEKPLQMPRGTCIDLSVSGMTPTGIEFNPLRPGLIPAQVLAERRAPVIIMFNPSGDVEQVYLAYTPTPPLGTINMLVGRNEQVNPVNVFAQGDDFRANLMDSENNWVAIGHRTGAVLSAENGLNNPVSAPAMRVFESREFARTAIDRGSR